MSWQALLVAVSTPSSRKNAGGPRARAPGKCPQLRAIQNRVGTVPPGDESHLPGLQREYTIADDKVKGRKVKIRL